jgi:multidrug efflux pump subunit AcrA (membrane-fusion protein)
MQDAREIARSAAAGARDGLQQAATELRAQARELAAQAREQVATARQQAQAGTEQAITQADLAKIQADAQAAAAKELEALTQSGTPTPGTYRIERSDGTVIEYSGNEPPPATATTAPASNYDGPPPGMIEGILGIIGGTFAGMTAMFLMYRLIMKWLENRGKRYNALPDDTAQRLVRMEATMDAMAVEIERISEGQRFTSRLLADRTPVELPRG